MKLLRNTKLAKARKERSKAFETFFSKLDHALEITPSGRFRTQAECPGAFIADFGQYHHHKVRARKLLVTGFNEVSAVLNLEKLIREKGSQQWFLLLPHEGILYDVFNYKSADKNPLKYRGKLSLREENSKPAKGKLFIDLKPLRGITSELIVVENAFTP